MRRDNFGLRRPNRTAPPRVRIHVPTSIQMLAHLPTGHLDEATRNLTPAPERVAAPIRQALVAGPSLPEAKGNLLVF